VSNDILVLAAAGAVALVALGIVVLARRRKGAATPGARAVARSPLAALPLDGAPGDPGEPAMVFARTHDGTLYQGKFVAFDAGMIEGAPVLALGGPIVFRRAGGEPETMPPVWDRLAIPVADVAELWMRSTPSTHDEPAAADDSHVEAEPAGAPDAPDIADTRRATDTGHRRRGRRATPTSSNA